MHIIGITGGVGSGKSEILHFLKKEYHAATLQLDEVAKTLQGKNGACFPQIVEHFGGDILSSDRELDRKALSVKVFQNPAELAFLNALVHPAVKKYAENAIYEERGRNTSLFIVEAALLIEADYGTICDELWYIYADVNVRKNRLKSSRGYTEEQIGHVMGNQLTEEEFRKHCQVVIDNSGDFENTKKQIGELL